MLYRPVFLISADEAGTDAAGAGRKESRIIQSSKNSVNAGIPRA